MSIRYYLLVLAGCITTIVSVGSFFVDNIIFSENLQKAKEGFFTLFKSVYEQKRENEERFLASLVAKNLAQVNTTLEVISKFSPLTEWFSSTEENKVKGTLNNAANLIQQDEWIDFLQNTTGSELLSLIIPEKGPFFEIEADPIEEGFAWVYIVGSASYENPFLGIQVPVKITEEGTGEKRSFLEAEVLPIVYILYEPNRFKTLTFPEKQQDSLSFFEQTSFAGGIEVDEVVFRENLSKAVIWMQNTSTKIPSAKERNFPLIAREDKQKTFNEKLTEDFQQKISYSNELFLIWQASILRDLGVFAGEGNWPDVMAFSSESLRKKQAFFVKPVMDFSKPLFDEASFFAANPPKQEKDFISSSSCVVKSSHSNQAFLVNTAKLILDVGEKKEISFLSLGFDLTPLLQNIAFSSARYGCIFSGGKVLINVAPEGKSVIASEALTPIFSEKLTASMGFVDIAGVSYHFSRMQPDPNIDLHFFFFDTKQEEFGFLYTFQSQVQEILKNNARDRKLLELLSIIILWILLLDVSKKITNPILALSSALKHVKKGNFELIRMPKVSFSKKNEIKQLFDAFYDMVEGMKEKEKIKGILNKVVSEEIAKEILQGDVKLGGEERVVSTLFADIRGFTKLTQNMPPQEVIGFLNKCMTKLSDVVEDNKGVIDKYMGDGLMALYGAPISYEESPLHAVISGLEMINTLKQWNQERIRAHLSPIYVGIGVHTGSVLAGNMGALNRLNYTVIGSAVNLASRLCSAAEPEELLITEDTYNQPCVKNNIEVEDKGFMTFKGFDKQMQVYRVVKLTTKDAGKFIIKEEGI